jgi:hypothetical protein
LFPRIKSQTAGRSAPLYVCFYPYAFIETIKVRTAKCFTRTAADHVPRALSVTLLQQLQCPLRATKRLLYTLEFLKVDSDCGKTADSLICFIRLGVRHQVVTRE